VRGSRSLLRDLGFLAGAQVAAQGFNLIALVILARRLGEHQFGLVQVGVAVSAYAMIAAEWGVFSLGVRDVARLRSPSAILEYARAQQGLLAVLAAVVLVLGLALLPLFPFYRADPALFRLYLLLVVPQVFALEWLATGLERMPAAGAAKVTASVVYAALVIFALPALDGEAAWPGYRWVPLMYLVSFAAGSAVIAPALRRWLGDWVRPGRAPGAVWRRRLGEAAPLGGSLLLMRVLINSDLILLGILSVPAVAGVYAAAAKVGFLIVVAMEVLWKALLPRLSRLAAGPAGERSPAYRARVQALFTLVMAVLVPVAVLAAARAPQLLDLLYGVRYAEAAPVFRILMGSYVLLALGWFLGGALLAVDRQRDGLRPQALAAGVAVAAHVLLIPRWGAPGAAWAMLAGHATLLGAMGLVSRRWFDRRLRASWLAVAAGAALMVGILWGAPLLAPGAGLWIPVLTAAVIYAACVVSPVRRLFPGLDPAPPD
jgi:O-antigen/teichoic acid export membrane protein